MNHQYVKKPSIVEAFHFTRSEANTGQSWPNWLMDAFDFDRLLDGFPSIWTNGEQWRCGTLKDPYEIIPGDWIIKGRNGEIYSCNPDFFEATYEKVV